MKTSEILASVLVACGLGACATTDYAYAPDIPNSVAAGMPAQSIAIPQEAPQGTVQITSYGIAALSPSGTTMPALHVRMIVANDGDAVPWTIDTSKQLVEIAGEGQSGPLFANADVPTLPVVAIAQHQRHVIDLYFPVPATVHSDAQLPGFQVLWQVTTPTRTVASRTQFDRVDRDQYADATYDSAYVDYAWPYWAGYGPYWWGFGLYPGFVGYLHPRHFYGYGYGHGGIVHGPVRVGHFGGHFRAGGGRFAGGGHIGGVAHAGGHGRR